MTTQPTTWPENVIARYLTVGGATVDITYMPADGLRAVCQGERCPWQDREFTGTAYDDSVEDVDRKITTALLPLQIRAQRHAETCRAMPKPTA
ncbi:hypothetical protein [Streptomyces sp. ML-6]|uniref:hypothetical protein n=1 Tax=Streptomyces sp. ML-6 TaxID=2982693 RepID=UPI0024BF2609|nr:hypothetical protein [Streptomyces sp. ML-6]MDK0524986.1 hypothetical protein [Streptomyces sp. ML-6]